MGPVDMDDRIHASSAFSFPKVKCKWWGCSFLDQQNLVVFHSQDHRRNGLNPCGLNCRCPLMLPLSLVHSAQNLLDRLTHTNVSIAPFVYVLNITYQSLYTPPIPFSLNSPSPLALLTWKNCLLVVLVLILEYSAITHSFLSRLPSVSPSANAHSSF